MKNVNTICINNYNYCKYPEGINGIEEFIKYLNKSSDKFIKLEVYDEKDCVEPFFIDGETKVDFFNIALIREIREAEIYVLNKEEYDERLKEVIAEKCIHCVNYSENVCEEDFESHRSHIDLNGKCYGFEKK